MGQSLSSATITTSHWLTLQKVEAILCFFESQKTDKHFNIFSRQIKSFSNKLVSTEWHWCKFLVIACFLFLPSFAGFLPSLKRLLGTPAYFLLICGSVLKFNSFIGLFTFKAKYMEQQFGQSASRANFLIGNGSRITSCCFIQKNYLNLYQTCSHSKSMVIYVK